MRKNGRSPAEGCGRFAAQVHWLKAARLV